MKNIKLKNIKFLLAISLAMLVSQSLFSQQQNYLKLKDKLITDSKASMKPLSSMVIGNKISSLNIKNDFLSRLDASMLNDSNTQKNIDKNTGSNGKKEKSVALGGLFSAVLPGSGEFYGGNFLKAAIFFGVEAASWGVYAYLQHKGDTKTNAFEAYANQYWSIHTYARWLVTQGFPGNGGINPDEQNWATLEAEIHVCESQNFSHTLPDQNTQQFYELIGKYQPFQPGWTNLAHVPTKDPGPYNFETYHDPVFVNYAFTRQDANNFYDYANTSLYFVVLNHILSMADAIWTVSTYNKNLRMQTGFRMNRFLSPYTYKYENMPTLNLTVNF
jgi:hypothetical protein